MSRPARAEADSLQAPSQGTGAGKSDKPRPGPAPPLACRGRLV